MKTIKEECVHFWLIDSPDGTFSEGRCKYCHVKRRFINAFTVALKKEGADNGKVRQPVV